jgi:uncharacterized iron-regulated membrane protein
MSNLVFVNRFREGPMRRDPTLLPALVVAAWALLLTLPAAADKIYRYVDQEGRVTYSSTPPPASEQAEEVTELDAPQAPRPEDVEAAKKRAEEQAKLARELLKERRQAEIEYERIRAAAAERSLLEQLAAAERSYDTAYYPASGYLPYYPMWGVKPVKPRPPFHPHPLFVKPHPKGSASLTLEPQRIPFRRR